LTLVIPAELRLGKQIEDTAAREKDAARRGVLQYLLLVSGLIAVITFLVCG
jgi:hypothetical protein